jgi:hypothetical protein
MSVATAEKKISLFNGEIRVYLYFDGFIWFDLP